MAREGWRRTGPEVASRGSRILGSLTSGGDGRRSAVIAVVSTVVFFTAVGLLITHAPGWPEVRRTFFDWGQFKSSLPEIARAFLLNVKIFCIAEAFILVFALLLAVVRNLPGPAALPLRIVGIAYADFFRGVPTILVIAMLGFGAPALQLQGVQPRRRSGASSRSSWSTPRTSRRSTAPASSRCIRARPPQRGHLA